MRRTVTGVLGIGLLDAFVLEALSTGAAASDGSLRHGDRSASAIEDGRRVDLDALRPRIHTRREWGARPPRKRATVLGRAPRYIVVHHTATPNYPDESLNHAYWLSRWIQRHHMQGRGWADTGQQLTISRGGHVMEGRNRTLSAIRNGRLPVGAQVRGHNRSTIGIENEGTYMDDEVPPRLWFSLEKVCAWLCARYELDPYRAIVGHRDFADTDCPGDVLYELLPDLRHRVAGRLERSTRHARPKKKRVGKKADSPPSRPDSDASTAPNSPHPARPSEPDVSRPPFDAGGRVASAEAPSAQPQQPPGYTAVGPLPEPLE